MLNRFPRVATLVAFLFALAGATALNAQGGETGFVPVQPGALGQERLPATPLVFIAYAFVWVALLGYVIFLHRRLAQVEDDLAGLSAGSRAPRP